MRLNKYLSESGACSRREADELIAEGRVQVNGAVAVLGTQVNEGDEVKLDGGRVGGARKKAKPVYIALHKPAGITCTTERHVAGNIVDFVNHPERIFPIGRLDKESSGLILLTNDGDIVNEILRVEHGHEKEYVVAIDGPVTQDMLDGMAAGVDLPATEDGHAARTKPCQVARLGPKVFRITLTQGLNRQIRRMVAAFGHEVIGLARVRIMHVRLGELPLGRWRNLNEQEIAALLPRGAAPQRAQQPPRSQQPGSQQQRPQQPQRPSSHAPRGPRSHARGRRR